MHPPHPNPPAPPSMLCCLQSSGSSQAVSLPSRGEGGGGQPRAPWPELCTLQGFMASSRECRGGCLHNLMPPICNQFRRKAAASVAQHSSGTLSQEALNLPSMGHTPDRVVRLWGGVTDAGRCLQALI